MLFQVCGALAIELLGLGVGVEVTIELDCKPQRGTVEVHHIRIDAVLPQDPQSVEPPMPDMLPHDTLRFGHAPPQPAPPLLHALQIEYSIHDAPSGAGDGWWLVIGD